MPLETIKLTAGFKLDGSLPESLFSMYREIVNLLLDYAWAKGVISFKKLKAEKYNELRMKYPGLPSHYIYTACQMACSIYKSFRKLKRRGLAKAEKPFFKKQVVMLDDHLFSVDLENGQTSIATESGRIKLKLFHGTYHKKFKYMRIGQAWLVKRGNDLYLKVVFSKIVELLEPNDKAIAVDINENNVVFGSENNITNIRTEERVIRTTYFLKRRKLQSNPRLNENPLLAKYKGREQRRINVIYHKIANQIITEAKRVAVSTVVLENLKNMRRKRSSKALNGRLNRWGFRKLQNIIDYKAKLVGLNVKYVDAKGTSSLCPICGGKLSPNGYRLMMCPTCGLEEDRDVIAVKNLFHKHQTDVGASSVHPKSPPMIGGGKE